jgi:CheY-like chemotaxis protein/HPt (histidine-containing phosphotransfer) domain-containing protein
MAVDSDPDLEMILADMRQEFIEASNDRLDEVEEAISRLLANKGKPEYEMLEIKRHVHSIKGMGGSFGFPSATLWAHALEDYLETVKDIGVDQLWDVQLFVDRVRDVLDGGTDIDGRQVADAIKYLPLRGVKRDRTGLKAGLSVLLLMPKGIQRKIVGRELTTFGFKVIIAESSLEAIDLGLTHRPDLIITSMLLDRMNGLELARVFSAIEATAHHKCMVITASDESDIAGEDLPDNVAVVHKGLNFSRDLIQFLSAQKLLET